MKKDYTVYFQGFFTVEANDEMEASDIGYEALKRANPTMYEITKTEEDNEQ